MISLSMLIIPDTVLIISLKRYRDKYDEDKFMVTDIHLFLPASLSFYLFVYLYHPQQTFYTPNKNTDTFGIIINSIFSNNIHIKKKKQA